MRIASPFEHGVWLVAYLVLVGFAAQLMLAWGQDALAASPPDQRTVLREAALWNLGVIAVPLGVLVGARLPVVIGSVCLLAALVDFWRAAIAGGRAPAGGPLRIGYLALLVAMSSSVFVGTALAWDLPWL